MKKILHILFLLVNINIQSQTLIKSDDNILIVDTLPTTFVYYQGTVPQTDTLINRMTVAPSKWQTISINEMVKSLVNKGYWYRFDLLYILAAQSEDDSKLNWISDNYNLVKNNTPTFTAFEGWTGNGSNGGLNTNYTPSIDGVNFKLNDGSWGLYNRTNDLTSLDYLFGSTITAATSLFYSFNVIGSFRPTLNQTTSVINTVNVIDSDIRGSIYATRNNSNNYNFIYNGNVTNILRESLALPTGNIYLLNANGSANGTFNQLAYFFIGDGFSTTEMEDIRIILETYLNRINATY